MLSALAVAYVASRLAPKKDNTPNPLDLTNPGSTVQDVRQQYTTAASNDRAKSWFDWLSGNTSNTVFYLLASVVSIGIAGGLLNLTPGSANFQNDARIINI